MGGLQPVLVLVILAAAGAPFVGALAPAPLPCEGFTLVPGQGPSCPVEGGWEVLLADGTRLPTHGPDPVPDALAAEVGPLLAAPVPPRCADDPADFAQRVLYARPADAPDRSAQMREEIRGMVESFNGFLRAESAHHGVALDYRVRCDTDGRVLVESVVLPLASAHDDFATITAALRAQGYASPLEKYWVWYDGRTECGCAGQGTLQRDNLLRAENQNNLGPSYALTYGYTGWWGAFIMMHESGHTLGAVSFQAPQTSGAGHCNDGLDIMCYADGGPESAYRSNVCRWEYRWDCNRDTYFHPDPPATSYLASHWNLGSPLNRFVQGCAREVGVLTSATAPLVFDVPPECEGRRYAAFHVHGYAERFRTCWRDAAGAPLGCDDGNVKGVERVPTGGARAEVTGFRPAPARVTFSIV